MRISLIAAVADNGIIGNGGDLPWRLPADLKHFKRHTLGKCVLMGQTTFESIGKPLKGRSIVVLSDAPGFSAPGCDVARSIDEALAIATAGEGDELMIAGGASVYAQLLPRAQRIYLTQVHAVVDGDVSFPVLDPAQWRETSREERAADDRNPYPMSFVVLERRVPG